jgi:hypothetical protein
MRTVLTILGVYAIAGAIGTPALALLLYVMDSTNFDLVPPLYLIYACLSLFPTFCVCRTKLALQVWIC